MVKSNLPQLEKVQVCVCVCVCVCCVQPSRALEIEQFSEESKVLLGIEPYKAQHISTLGLSLLSV